MQLYTETLSDNFDVTLPAGLLNTLDLAPGDTVVFEVKGRQARISGLSLAEYEPAEDDKSPLMRRS